MEEVLQRDKCEKLEEFYGSSKMETSMRNVFTYLTLVLKYCHEVERLTDFLTRLAFSYPSGFSVLLLRGSTFQLLGITGITWLPGHLPNAHPPQVHSFEQTGKNRLRLEEGQAS